MASPYNVRDWYWDVLDTLHGTHVYSTAASGFVLVSNPTYLNWLTLGGGNTPTVIGTLVDLTVVINRAAASAYISSGFTVSSATNVTLTNPLPTVSNITLTSTANKVFLPLMNTPSGVPIGVPFIINNKANDRTIQVYAVDTVTLLANVDRGGAVTLTLTDNSIGNGAFIVNVNENKLTQNVRVIGNVNATIANTDRIVTTDPGSTIVGVKNWTMPLAAEVNPAQPISLFDVTGALAPGHFGFTGVIALLPQGSDTINGAPSFTLATPYAGYLFWSDGVSKWQAQPIYPYRHRHISRLRNFRSEPFAGSAIQVQMNCSNIVMEDDNTGTTAGFTDIMFINQITIGNALNCKDDNIALIANSWLRFYYVAGNNLPFGTVCSVASPLNPGFYQQEPNPILGGASAGTYPWFGYATTLRLNGIAQLVPARTHGDYVAYEASVNALAAGAAVGATPITAVALGAIIPPEATKYHIRLICSDTGAGGNISRIGIVSGVTHTDIAVAAGETEYTHIVLPNIGQQLFYNNSVAAGRTTIDVLGYWVPNGDN